MYPTLPIPEYPVIPARSFVTPAEDRLEARRAIRREAAARHAELAAERYATTAALDRHSAFAPGNLHGAFRGD